jgi:beta-glucanase (GH16 family)
MKRFKVLFFLGIISIGSLYSQPLYDQNWNTTTLYFEDNFNPPRSSWSTDHWMDKYNDNKWKAHLAGDVTHGTTERQVYQKEYAIFSSSDSTIRLRAENAGQLLDTSEYDIPLNGIKHPDHGPIYYRSGALCIGQSTKEKTKYGYFEIKCKLPVNCGAFPAFWLFDSSNNNYREIDVFEYSWYITEKGGNRGSSRYFEGQVYYYNGPEPLNRLSYTYGQYGYHIPTSVSDLTNWHKFGMEWSPKQVKWYFDDVLINSYVGDSVPSMSMNVIVNNAVDNYATPPGGVPMTIGFPEEMIIDYVKIYKLKCDSCSTNGIIYTQNDLTTFNYKVYKNITIGGSGNTINIPINSKVAFRATDGITINGVFNLPVGSTLDLITHACPN